MSSSFDLNKQCRRFEQLYHGRPTKSSSCLGTNVAQEYLCPLVSRGQIAEQSHSDGGGTAQNPWFSKQNQNNFKCHKPMPLLGKYHLCPNQSNYSHYQEDPFQRGQFASRNQKGGYVFTVTPQGSSYTDPNPDLSDSRPDPYEQYPAQEGYYVERCVGNRNLVKDRTEMTPHELSTLTVPPMTKKVTIQSNKDGSMVSVTGVSKPMEYMQLETPSEMTNEFMVNSNITPSYYPDMVYDNIGKRPVYTARNLEYDIPEILTVNKPNLVGYDAGCRQPNWRPNCI